MFLAGRVRSPEPRAFVLRRACTSTPGGGGVECPPGKEGWVDANDMPETLVQLLKLIGGTYLPFLVANDSAISQKMGTVEVPIFLGKVVHKQPPFKWQIQ